MCLVRSSVPLDASADEDAGRENVERVGWTGLTPEGPDPGGLDGVGVPGEEHRQRYHRHTGTVPIWMGDFAWLTRG